MKMFKDDVGIEVDKSQVEILKKNGYITADEYEEAGNVAELVIKKDGHVMDPATKLPLKAGGRKDAADPEYVAKREAGDPEGHVVEGDELDEKKADDNVFVELTPQEFKKLSIKEKEEYTKARNAAGVK